MVEIIEIDEYFLKRNRNHEWFNLSDTDKTEYKQRAVDTVLLAYPLKNDLSEDNFHEQDSDYQDRIKLVVYKLIDFLFLGHDEIQNMRNRGLTRMKDPVSDITLHTTEYRYRLGTLELYNLIKPYIKNVKIQSR